MTDNEIIKGLFADGVSIGQIARTMAMSQADVCGAILGIRVYVAKKRATPEEKLLCIMAAVYNPTLTMEEVSLIGEQATGTFYAGEQISRWMAWFGMSVRQRTRMAIRYQSKAHAMWTLFIAGRLEVSNG